VRINALHQTNTAWQDGAVLAGERQCSADNS
jgi:hypothetical protein